MNHFTNAKATLGESYHATVKQRLKKYAYNNDAKAFWQLTNTLCPLVVCVYLLWKTYTSQLYPVSLLLGPLSALLLVRVFVLQHDCGHHTFFSNKRINNTVGFFLGILNFTPLLNWRYSHNLHHATNGHLERRGVGDVWMLTQEEYERAPYGKKILYRLYRNPIFLFFLGPLVYFVIRRRFCIDITSSMKKEYRDLIVSNIAICFFYGSLAYVIGWKTLLILALPVFAMTAALGVWLFYVQHVFEEAYWERSPRWNFYDAALEGSTFYDLPKWLHWFTANIGYHHIHHLESRIPNYHLQKCMEENRELFHMPIVRLSDTWRLMQLKLWDEQNQRYVPFRK